MQVAPPGGKIFNKCKWSHQSNLQPTQVAPPSGQFFYQCKWRDHVVPNLQPNLNQSKWRHLEFQTGRATRLAGLFQCFSFLCLLFLKRIELELRRHHPGSFLPPGMFRKEDCALGKVFILFKIDQKVVFV